jgi:hypothetical protein
MIDEFAEIVGDLLSRLAATSGELDHSLHLFTKLNQIRSKTTWNVGCSCLG